MKNSIFNAVCKTRYLALLVVLILTCGNVWGADPTLVITRSCFPSGSLAYNVTDAWTATASTGETINGEGDLYSTASQTTMQTKNSSVSTHYHNLTAIPGAITNISVDVASGTDRKYEVYASSSAIITSKTGLTKLGDLTGASSVDLPAASKYRYFWLQCTGGASFLNNITITYEEPSYTFTRISSVGDLEAGDDIVIVNQSENYALSTTQNTNNRGRASISATNHTFTYSPSSGVQVLTVSINSGYYSFHDGTGYLKQPSNNNYLQRDAALGDNTKWSLSVSNYVFSITSKRNSQYYIAYNSGNSIFSAYNQNQEKPYIYKRQTSTCATPTALTKGSISATGFTATWTAPSSAPANGYYVAYSTSSTTPGDITASSGDYTVVSVGAGTTEKAISGLTDGGLYYFWVRSRCSASDNSGWSDRASVQLSKITLNQTSLTGMTYVYNGASGGPSTQTKSFTVTGTNVGGNLTVSAPTNFQVSTDNSSWGSSKTITATSGSASGTVYVRLAGGLNAGSYGSASTYVTVSDGGSKASSKNVSVQGSVTQATLNPSFGSAIYNITRDVSTSTSFTLTNVPSDYTGDITYQRTNSPTYSSYLTIDGSEKTFTASRSGNWTVTAQFAADANYNAKASGVTCTVNAVMRDTYVDNVNGQSVTEAQRTDDGVNPYTSPSFSDVAAGSACKGTKTHLIGWATATFIANVGNGTLTGADSDYTQANGFYAVGETLPAASGATYYAVYGEEE